MVINVCWKLEEPCNERRLLSLDSMSSARTTFSEHILNQFVLLMRMKRDAYFVAGFQKHSDPTSIPQRLTAVVNNFSLSCVNNR